MNEQVKIDDVMKKLSTLEKSLAVKRSKEQELLAEKEKLEKDIEDLKITDYEKCGMLLKRMSGKQKKIACVRLEELGTAALQYSLGPDYEMKIHYFEGKGNSKPYLDTKIKDRVTGIETDPIDENGGGVVDIVSIALRLVVMQTYEPTIDGPILMDEPFKMVSKEFIPMLSQFTKNVSQDFGRQIIMVTHNEYLAAMTDSKIYVTMDKNKISVVEEVI